MREREVSSISWFTPKYPQRPGIGQAQARSPEPHVGLSRGGRDTAWAITTASQEVPEQETGTGSGAGTLIQDVGGLNHCAKRLPCL